MRFQRPDNPTPYLNRRDQWRLMVMVSMLLWSFGMEYVARPSSWYWLTGPPTDSAEATQLEQSDATTIDARLNEDPLMPGEVRVVGEQPAGIPIEFIDAEKSVDAGQIDPQVFSQVQDNSLGIRHAERDAYFHVLAAAGKISDQELYDESAKEVTFAQMFTDPNEYRGRLVTLRGQVKQLTSIKAGANEQGFDTLYEAWMLTADAGNNPLVLHFSELPAEIPTGKDLDLTCEFTGYFFKKYAYAAGHGPHSTTLLLGKRLDWSPPVPVKELGISSYIFGIVLWVGICLALLLWRYSASDRKFQRAHLDRLTKSVRGDIPELKSNSLESASAEGDSSENSSKQKSD